MSCYDEALRAIEAGTYTPALAAGLKERLATVFNRGFWEGYYAGRPVAEHSQHYGSAATRRKVYVGKVTNFYKRISVAEVLVEAASAVRGRRDFLHGVPPPGIAEQTLAELHDTDGTPAQSVAQAPSAPCTPTPRSTAATSSTNSSMRNRPGCRDNIHYEKRLRAFFCYGSLRSDR